MLKIRKAIKYLSRPRQLMYLYALLVVVWLHAFYLIYENSYLKAKLKSDQEIAKQEKILDKRLQKDMNTARKAYDTIFDPDEVIRNKTLGTFERFLNLCNRNACRVISGLEPTRDVCNKELSTSRNFHKYRVYSCKLKITLENDGPMDCTRINWNDLKGFCYKVNNT